MEKVTVQIQTLEDIDKHNKIVDRLPDGDIIECEDIVFGIIESGTEQGRESILISGVLPSGDNAVMQITGRHLENIYKIFKGAQMQFKAKRNQN